MTEKYLQPLYESWQSGQYLIIAANLLPDKSIADKILNLDYDESLYDEYGLIACRLIISSAINIIELGKIKFKKQTLIIDSKRIHFLQNLFEFNRDALHFDFELLTTKMDSQQLPETVQAVKVSSIFVEQGATLNHCIINASMGPVYIGKDALIMEGCCIRGPFAAGEKSVLKMGTKIYGATTVGPYSTVGGEIKNSIINSFSNKAHDGYLGDSVIGEWCNLGAGTTNSNVKNTGGNIGLWDYDSQKYLNAGNKCGVIMGDFSRTAINTSLNTGTVVGLCCNVFGNGLTPKFIPDFSWGFNEYTPYNFDKALQDIANWKAMKKATLSEKENQVLKYLHQKMVK